MAGIWMMLKYIKITKHTTFPFFDNADVDTFSQNKWVAGSYNLKIANDHTGGGQVWSISPIRWIITIT